MKSFRENPTLYNTFKKITLSMTHCTHVPVTALNAVATGHSTDPRFDHVAKRQSHASIDK